MFSAATRGGSREPVRSAAITLPARRSLHAHEPPRARGGRARPRRTDRGRGDLPTAESGRCAHRAGPVGCKRLSARRQFAFRPDSKNVALHVTEFPALSPALPIDLASGLSLDAAAARRAGEERSAEYCFAEPFPHIVVDDFLPEP